MREDEGNASERGQDALQPTVQTAPSESFHAALQEALEAERMKHELALEAAKEALKEAEEKRKRDLKEAEEKAEEKRKRDLKEAEEKAEEKRKRDLKEAEEKAEEKRKRDLKEAEGKAEEKRKRDLKEAEEKAEEKLKEAKVKRKRDLEQNDAKRKGELWLHLPMLTLIFRSFNASGEKSYEEIAGEVAGGSIFSKFLPRLLIRQMAPAWRCWPQRPGIITDCFGKTRSQNYFEKAHLIPWEPLCWREWIIILVPFVAAWGFPIEESEQLCYCLLLGFVVNGCQNRFPLSGLIHNVINFLGLRTQEGSMDQDPTVMFIPLMSLPEMMGWSGQAYQCLMIGSSADVMLACGAYEVHNRSNDEFCCELDISDSSVMRAFSYFGDTLCVLSQYLAGKSLETPDGSNKTKLCSLFFQFLKEEKQIPCPGLPHAPGVRVVCLNFKAIEPRTPGVAAQTHYDGRSCPHPLLLALRGCNGYVNHIHQTNAWPKWTEFLRNKKVPDCVKNAPLVFRPSCKDVVEDGGRCLICKSSYVKENPHRYSSDIYRLADEYRSGSELTEEESERLMSAKAKPEDDDIQCDSKWSSSETAPSLEHLAVASETVVSEDK